MRGFFMGFLSGPTPPQSNPAIAPQDYQPSRFVISAITPGATTTVTMTPSTTGGTTVNPNYVIGQLVRFNIPKSYGIQQINEQTGYVLSIPSSTQVVVNINSSFYDAFISSPTDTSQDPQIVAVGDINQGYINSSPSSLGTYVPGSFIDIS
jgi:hypothetical protein